MPESARIGIRDFFVALITAIASIAGSYFMFAGASKHSDATMVDTLAKQYQELQKNLFEQQAELISLRIELSRTL